MRGKTLSFLLIVLLVIAPVIADSKIILEPLKNSVLLSETAYYNLTVINNASETQRYSIFSFVQGWDIETSPLKDKILDIAPGQNKTTTIKVLAQDSFNPGIYKLALNIESDLGEKYTTGLVVYISPDTPLSYLPSITADLVLDKNINPQKPVTIKLDLENKNPLNLSNLTIKVTSEISEFNQETKVSIPPLEKKSIEFTLTLDPYQKPGNYYLFITLERNKDVVKIIPYEITILPLTPNFLINFSTNTSFLKKSQTLMVMNPGNTLNTQNVTVPVTILDVLFVRSTAKSEVIDGQRYLVWAVTLPSKGSTTLNVIYSYRPLLYLAGILILFSIVYWYLRPAIKVRKRAVATKQDATLSELKITLNLKNLSKNHLREIEVVDLIPGIADIEKNLDMGTV